MPQHVLQVGSAPGARRMAVGGMASVVAGLVLTVGTVTIGAQTAPPHVAARPLASLNTVPVPVPPDLGNYLKDTTPGSGPMVAAQQLGKALFWDMQVGSDGVQACASCHFEAGADNRRTNQVSPGVLDTPQDKTFQVGGGPNYTLQATDFPFHVPGGRDSNDVVSSQGVFRRNFPETSPDVVVSPGGVPPRPAAVTENCTSVPDEDGFSINGLNVRRVEPRNAPTVVNAVFNFRNFWDGRAQNDFNGSSPFGFRDPNAGIWLPNPTTGALELHRVSIRNGSLASQAVGPPGSKFEMSCLGRPFDKIGRKLLSKGVFPLAKQHVDPTDGVLGPIAMPNKGLSVSYSTLIQAAFRPQYWNNQVGLLKSGQDLKKDASATMDLVPRPNAPTPVGDTFSQMELNFSLFFGLSVQLYESTLIANQTPFDRFMEDPVNNPLSVNARAGLGLFSSQFGSGQGKCDACHGGPELTNASVANVANERLERMIMGNDGIAVYDNGFYNTAVRKTTEDPGVGGSDPFGNPLSETAFCEQKGVQNCPIKNQDANGQLQNTSIAATIAPRPGEPVPVSPLLAAQCPAGATTSVFDQATGTYKCDRINVMGAFKTPGLRNVELTGPYMHNGGMATLRQVVDFYNRGGDFPAQNQDNLDPNIVPLGLSSAQADQLVEFMKALTDPRVKSERAPFDHPQLFVPNGHPGTPTSVTEDPKNPGQATDTSPLLEIPAVGAAGGPAVQSFTDKLSLSQNQP